MGADPLQQALDDIEDRRAAVGDLASELRRRIDELGQIRLDTEPRQAAFSEAFEAITPPGFEIFPMPDECKIDPAGHSITLSGAVVDRRRGQVVGIISRQFELDAGSVEHAYLQLQRPYRGGGLATLLLKRSFDFYALIGMTRVRVHAALETGRWYWARLGFDFAEPGSRGVVATWGSLALAALGEAPLPPHSPARRWAQLGSGEPTIATSLGDLHSALDAHIRAQPLAGRAHIDALAKMFSEMFGVDWLSRARFLAVAEANDLDIADPIPIGRAIMLTGPDWNGVFDLSDTGSRAAFEEELNRALKRSAGGS